MSDDAADDGQVCAVVLDILPQGRPDDDRPQYERSPVAYAVAVEDFGLYELELADDADISIVDRVVVAPDAERDPGVTSTRAVSYDALSSGAQSELDYVVEDIVDENERRFVDVYNDAGPITLRLHQLDLLPGIGETLRNNILDARKRQPFESFDDVDERVSGLHDPRSVIVERVLAEIKEAEDMKYHLLATAHRE